MDIRNLDMLIGGRRYRTEDALLIARGCFPDEKTVSDSGLATTLLYRTPRGRYFRQIQSHSPAIIRDMIEPVNRDEALQEYLQMAVTAVPFEQAFPGASAEEA